LLSSLLLLLKPSCYHLIPRPHYSWPPNPTIDVPAELEVIITEEGEITQCNNSNSNSNAPDYSVIKSVCIKPEPHGAKFGSKYADAPQGKLYQDAMVSLLKQCTSLEELHWHRSKHCEIMLTRLVKETTLPATLLVLSIPGSRDLTPEAMTAGLPHFHQVQSLDFQMSLDMEHGTHFESMYRDPYDSGPEVEEDMPYSEPLLAAAQSMPGLKELNLNGIMNFDCFKYCLNASVPGQLRGRGVNVILGCKEHW